jgi:hypothetical protein
MAEVNPLIWVIVAGAVIFIFLLGVILCLVLVIVCFVHCFTIIGGAAVTDRTFNFVETRS